MYMSMLYSVRHLHFYLERLPVSLCSAVKNVKNGNPRWNIILRTLDGSCIFYVGFLLLAQIPLCDSGTNRFGSSSEQFDWLGTDHHCAQFCFEKSWSDLLQGFTDNCHRAATRIQTPSARDGDLDKCGNVIPFWRKFPVPTEIGSWP